MQHQPATASYSPPKKRLDAEALRKQVEWVASHPLVRSLLGCVGGVLAVLNEQRQVLALNAELLEALGVSDAGKVLGLRPGEVLSCAHAGEGAGGCGTGSFCPSCGAAVSMVVALGTGEPEERDCALAVERDGTVRDTILKVRCAPLSLDGELLLLLFLRDVTDEHWRQKLERTFFHDVNNILCGMVSAAELQDATGALDPDLLGTLTGGTRRLMREVQVQRALTRGQPKALRPRVAPVRTDAVAESLRRQFADHPATDHRRLRLRLGSPAPVVSTDEMFLERVLVNMLTNAFEAVGEGAEVELAVDKVADGVTFEVKNPGTVTPEAQKRMFQAHFSTKVGGGRGLGTYAMRLFGESVLKGKVSFESSEQAGTLFRLWLPFEPPA